MYDEPLSLSSLGLRLIGERFAHRVAAREGAHLAGLLSRMFCGQSILGGRRFQFFKLQFQLINQPGAPFRRDAVFIAAQLGNLKLEFLDLDWRSAATWPSCAARRPSRQIPAPRGPARTTRSTTRSMLIGQTSYGRQISHMCRPGQAPSACFRDRRFRAADCGLACIQLDENPVRTRCARASALAGKASWKQELDPSLGSRIARRIQTVVATVD